MLMIGFPAAAFDTNCFVLATGEGQECVVVDPGIGVTDTLSEVLRELRLRPAAVLLTHGHLDHVYSVTPVCRGGGAAAYIHGDDRYRLRDPLADLDRGMIAMMEAQFGAKATWTEPDDIRELRDGETVTIAGLDFGIVHAPGHTEGSVMFTLADVPEGINVEVGSTVVSGDVLFAGSIGRSDLPGGDERAMNRSLRDCVLPMPDDRLVLPGHGPLTTIGRERASNPYLRGLR
ncbi:MAG: MBL fold metallo-hydrolase [Actinomycetales bacterium]|uniref:MBL fold metallo-hydrolase n=1 Tax=Candidatus Phosphoribacter hodrii TaxID=2953743 RepID=A0A935MGM5_9MICO|nr:MBL fold metallo-hydrolase [Candidatus Phosphoribacter hodrii]